MLSTTDLASRLADLIARELALEEDRRQVVYYSLDLVFSGLLGFMLIAIVSLPLGLSVFSLTTCLAGAGIRLFSGGAHCSSAGRCAVSGAIVFTCLGAVTSCVSRSGFFAIPEFRLYAAGCLLIVALVAVGSWAPTETPGKPIPGKYRRYLLKASSLGVAFIYAWFVGLLDASSGYWGVAKSAMLVGGLWQSFTLSPPAHRLLALLDRALLALRVR